MVYDLHKSIGYQLTTASRVNEANIDRVLSEYGLTRMSYVTLVAVGTNSLSQPSSIADFLGVGRPSVSRALNTLEDAGLIERDRAASDKRCISVRVTRKGTELLRVAGPRVVDCNDKMVAGLSPKERDQFMHLLMRINLNRPSIAHL